MKIKTTISLPKELDQRENKTQLFLSELFKELSIHHTELSFFLRHALPIRISSTHTKYDIDKNNNFTIEIELK